MPYSAPGPFLGAQTASAYQVSRSLRFRSSASAYLSRTPASATSRTTWTYSVWFKLGNNTSDAILFNAGPDGNNRTIISLSTGTTLQFADITAGSVTFNKIYSGLLRDPSAWYHLVATYDSTNATASDRARFYINGSRITSFSTSVDPSSSLNGWVNTANLHAINRRVESAAGYFDGYLAEVNFIDGQALTPSSFGAFDSNGIWQPARYTGSYGTNGFYLPFSLSASSTYAGSFNGSSQLLSIPDNAVFTMGSGDFTIEAWVNFAASGRQIVIYQGDAAGLDSSISFYLERSSLNYLRMYVASGATSYIATGTTVIPNNQWVHIAGVRNGNNIVCYLNGIQQATTSVTGVTINDSTNPVQISGYGNGSASGLLVNGSISNVRIVKGTAVYTSNFTPPSQALTAITGTSLLCLQSSSPTQENSGNSLTITNVGTVTTSTATPFVANVTADASGNNNGWIPANINASSSGTTYDSMIDSPTNYADGGNGRGNYCTWNPTDKNSTVVITDGNLSANSGAVASAHRMVFGSQGFTTASYFEITTSGGTTGMICMVGAGQHTTGTADGVYAGSYSKSFANGYATNATNWYSAGVTNANGSSTNLVDGTWGFAVDPANGKAWVRNTAGNWIGGGDPAAGTLPTFTWTSDGLPWFPIMSFYNVATTFVGILNAGQRSYAFTAPSGFSALNTQNLPTPTIAAGNKYFDATTYTATGTTPQSITNSGSFQPDLVWTKTRSTTGGNLFIDAVRGASLYLVSNTTNAEATDANYLTSFNANGFSLGNTNYTSGTTMVGWQWNAGGSTVAGTGTGGITNVSYRANPTAGFSIITYTGSGANGTVTHGLGVAPSMIIVKNRSTSDWAVYHKSTTAAGVLWLNLTNAYGAFSAAWNSTEPTSTVFSVGTATATNASSSSTHVAYCFAPVAGYSSFGSYTGNGSADGPMIFTGFRPRWVMIKNTDTAGRGWEILDTSRNTYNVSNSLLQPDSASAESNSSSYQIDFVSNGFKIRGIDTWVNASSGTYIYAAFCELPFKNSRAR